MGKSVSRPTDDSADSSARFGIRVAPLSEPLDSGLKRNSGYYPFCATMGVLLNFRAISLLNSKEV
jgi:hypothetical protein